MNDSLCDNGKWFWVYPQAPPLPHFESIRDIREIVTEIKRNLDYYLLEGLQKRLPESHLVSKVKHRCQEFTAQVWLLALKSQRYGVIYFLSRAEAIAAEGMTLRFREEVDLAGDILTELNLTNPVFNYAIQKFALKGNHHLLYEESFIPPFSFMSVAPDAIILRRKDMADEGPDAVLDMAEALYDLHDFAHLAATRLHHGLYGAKYFPTLLDLPSRYLHMISSPGFQTDEPLHHADRLVFSEFLTHLFNHMDLEGMTNEKIVDKLAATLVPYFFGEQGLYHPSSGKVLQADRPVTIEELAILAQNKAYELTASEIEQQVFTRGGKDKPDELAGISTSQRIARISAKVDDLFYFEKRNVMKHRSQKEAYRRVARRWQSFGNLSRGELSLLEQIQDNLDFEDYHRGHRKDLFHQVKQGREA